MTWEILTGDCRDLLQQLPAQSVHTVVTSPPYFGLRDYATGEWEGGDETCDHGAARIARRQAGAQTDVDGGVPGSLRDKPISTCGCGAVRADRQIGLEPTPTEFVTALVEVFRSVRRVLRDDGTVWLNLGDSYAGGGTTGEPRPGAGRADGIVDERAQRNRNGLGAVRGAKPKDLIGIPWMVAFALRADGWYLRADIIWAKPNPMPESVTDRPTRSHEFIFLLTKNARYHYDADAIREQGSEATVDRWGEVRKVNGAGASPDRNDYAPPNGGTSFGIGSGGRNKRDVWTVSTKPYAGAHFATFPPDLIEPCVLAGCPERACGVCGAPWERIVERESSVRVAPQAAQMAREKHFRGTRDPAQRGNAGMPRGDRLTATAQTLGCEPSCECGDTGKRNTFTPAPTVSGTVLDPFAGAGTTGIVAARNRRSFIGLELNPEYAQMARDRIETDLRIGHRSPQRVDVDPDQLGMFDALEEPADLDEMFVCEDCNIQRPLRDLTSGCPQCGETMVPA